MVIELAAQLMSYVIAAIRAYGGAVLQTTQDDAAEATVGLGRRVLQRIFGTRAAGEQCPSRWPMWRPTRGDQDAAAALRLAIRKALAADPRLRADVEGMLASAGVSVTAAGERSIAAHTITGVAATGDNTTINR